MHQDIDKHADWNPSMSVILEVPVPTAGQGVRPRCRRAEHIVFADLVPVEVRVLSSEEAPVVMQARFGNNRRFDYRGKPGDNLDGSFWEHANTITEGNPEKLRMLRPVWPSDWDEPVNTATIGSFIEEIVAASITRPQRWGLIPDAETVSLRAFVPEIYRSFTLDNHDTLPSRYKELWSRAAFIDGVLHVPSAGPAWMVNFVAANSRENHPSIVDVDIQLRLVQEVGFIQRDRKSFAPDRLLEANAAVTRNAREWAFWASDPKSFGRHCSWTGRILEPKGSFHDLRPRQEVPFPTSAAMAAIRWLIDSNAGKIGTKSTTLIRQFADLRDAVDESSASSPAAISDLLARAIAFREAYQTAYPANAADDVDLFGPVIELVAAWQASTPPCPPEDLSPKEQHLDLVEVACP